MIDLDDFNIATILRTSFGDEVLKRVSATFNANTRIYDSVGRYAARSSHRPARGGRDEAVAMIERLKEKVAGERFYGHAANGG